MLNGSEVLPGRQQDACAGPFGVMGIKRSRQPLLQQWRGVHVPPSGGVRKGDAELWGSATVTRRDLDTECVEKQAQLNQRGLLGGKKSKEVIDDPRRKGSQAEPGEEAALGCKPNGRLLVRRKPGAHG